MFFSDGFTNKAGTKYGYNTSLRAVWRPINEEQKLVHVGVSGLFKVPDQDKKTKNREVRLGGNGFNYFAIPQFQSAVLDDVKNQVSMAAEFYLYNSKWMAQGEWMMTMINRRGNLGQYRAEGAYVQAGYLIRGSHFGYAQGNATTAMPTDKGSLLLAVRYNFTNLNHSSVKVFGGRQQDLAIGLNYYFNRYISTRLNYTYMMLDKHSPIGKSDFHAIQARIQIGF